MQVATALCDVGLNWSRGTRASRAWTYPKTHRLRQPHIDGRAVAGRNRPSPCLRQRNLAMPHEFTGPGGTYTIFEPELASDAPAFSDEALALHFADQYAKDLRYVAAWGRWLH